MHNIRFPEIWDILTKHIDFQGKTLLDVGCGYGDLVKAAHKAGAKVWGIDKDVNHIHALQKYIDENFQVSFTDIDYFVNSSSLLGKTDILTCFSVLPYLKEPEAALWYFGQLADTVIIECQYHGDGPGPEWLKNDDDMRAWLHGVWDSVEKIGQTEVKGRGTFRSIWMCKD